MTTKNNLKITLVPPSPCSDKIMLDIRASIFNDSTQKEEIIVSLYLDEPELKNLIYKEKQTINSNQYFSIRHWWPTMGRVGKHKIIAKAEKANESVTAETEIEVVASDTICLKQISGAWVGINHWSDQEGKFWQEDIKKLTDDDWRQVVKGMEEIGMKIIVIQETIRNQEYVGKHKIEKEGYKGKAYYPSKLYSGKMPMAAVDPIDAILDEADKRGCYVFLGVGLYAWFDFTKDSLKWHKNTAKELWALYGHHKSFYGWYISEEIFGNLGDDDKRREEITVFFKEFKKHVRSLCPDKPIMLAPNCHNVLDGIKYWPLLLENVDIICPFGFHRMPEGDLTGEQVTDVLRKLCDQAKSQFWLDMEVFLFAKDEALYPRPIEEITEDFKKYNKFEKILCYQFPGLMNPPWANFKLGGEPAVKLYNDYSKYLETNYLKK
jgi:hypothetical protein